MIATSPEVTGALRIQQGSSSVTIHANGSVELTPGVKMDDAARMFWDAVEKNFPHEAAVKAERERCAEVADSCPNPSYAHAGLTCHEAYERTCRYIKERILSGR